MPQQAATSDMFMIAARMHRRGGPEVIVVEQAARPRPAAGEALIRVHAAAITRGELDWEATWHDNAGQPRVPSIPSHEVSGVIEQVPQGFTDLKVGDEVFALIDFNHDGAAAEYASVAAQALALKPRSLDHVHAAAIPLSALTAWQALFDHGRITGGMRVLVVGGGGAVGLFAVQIARWAGAKVAATASAENADFVRGLGAETIIDSGTERIEEVADDFDIVLDTVGGEMLTRASAAVREGGALITVAGLPAPRPRHATRAHPFFFVVKPDSLELARIAELADAGGLRPLVAEVYPLAETRAAYQRIARGRVRGKVVIKLAD
jgi:NADPH:quinone reductase-like Zn-dependent oxidoreductase